MHKIAHIDRADSGAAFRLGFAKAAHDMGLDEATFERFCKIASEVVSKQPLDGIGRADHSPEVQRDLQAAQRANNAAEAARQRQLQQAVNTPAPGGNQTGRRSLVANEPSVFTTDPAFQE